MHSQEEETVHYALLRAVTLLLDFRLGLEFGGTLTAVCDLGEFGLSPSCLIAEVVSSTPFSFLLHHGHTGFSEISNQEYAWLLEDSEAKVERVVFIVVMRQ